MNVFGIGLPELAVIAAIGLLVFGPKRLPELGKTLGRTLKGFQSASREFEQEFRRAVDSVEAEVASADTSTAELTSAELPSADLPSSELARADASPAEHSPAAGAEPGSTAPAS
ncbi:MAG: TatA/E family twin arginine-targeting protein translocase [Synechococcaceae bacterium WB8_1B_136]|nr:TatA/E family twin arginine-targeting protein translocase [Synechococcaceae bacterium WB8_1B_136]